MMSTVFVIMLWSSGMPILYFIGFIFFSATYLTNKLLLIKFYLRTLTNSRIIPLFSAEFLKIGLAVHIIGALFMLTNPSPFKTDEDLIEPIINFNMVKDSSYFKEVYEDNKDSWFLTRFKYLHQQIYVMFVLFLLIIYIIGKACY